MESIQELSKLIKRINTEAELLCFFKELLTESELETLSKRWRIMTMLFNGATQREVAKELHVSLCKITRGAAILKNSVLSFFKDCFSVGATMLAAKGSITWF